MDLDSAMATLKEERLRREISRGELARRAGWANESVPRRLEDPEGNPTVGTIKRYAKAINMEVTVSVGGMRVISFFNHAGGVGKTSAARDMGFALAQEGFRVLAVDADPQANLTEWLGLTEGVDLDRTLKPAVLPEGEDGGLTLPEPVATECGLDLIPSSLDLASVEPALVGEIMGVTRLRNAIHTLTGYDFVLVDSPPSLGQLSALAVIASDHVVVPVPTSIKGMQGIKTVISMVSRYRQAAPDLSIALFVLTHYDSRTNHDRQAAQSLTQMLSATAPVSEPLAERPAIYKDASMNALPVGAQAPGSEAASEIQAATELLMERLGVSVNV